MAPQRPSNLHPLAEELLDRLKDHSEASEIVIGGGVALSHYSEHRDTFDLDAWWKSHPKPETIEFVRAAMKQIAHLHRSAFEENQRCDVISFNIKEASGQKGFFCSYRVKFMRFTKQRSPRRRPFARAALTRT